MDLIKCGAFLALRRRALGLTQQELAEKLGVTDKAVSRWETGRGFPDVSLLRPLSDALGVSIAELVNGEAAGEDAAARADDAVLEAFQWSRAMRGRVVGTLLMLCGVFALLMPLYGTFASSVLALGSVLLGAALFALGLALRRGVLNHLRFPARVATAGSFAALAAALALEISPWGVVMIFAPGPDLRVRQTYSFFSLMPLGYGNAFPILAAGLTVAVVVLLAIDALKKRGSRRLRDAAYVVTWIAAALAAVPLLLFGWDGLSAAGAAVIVLLAVSAWFQAMRNALRK